MSRVFRRNPAAAALVAALAPILGLGAVRIATSVAPASAAAATDPLAQPAALRPVRARPTPAQLAALEHIQTSTTGDSVANPFFYPPGSIDSGSPVLGPQPVVVAPADPRVAPTPDFVLSAILGGGVSPLAVINGRTLRIGQEAAPGWTLIDVDERGRTALLSSDDGRTAKVQIRR